MPSIVSHIRRDYYSSLGNPDITEAQLLSWYADQKLLQRSETIYSDALNLIGDTSRSRQHYLRRFFDGKKPGVCHNAIAKLIALGCLDVVLTTNFDSLTEDAIRNNGICLAPKVAAHSQQISDVLLTEPGPKVIKLHGDYLFSDIKNTQEETVSITNNMREKLRNVLNERGLVVIGYSGNDNSVMSIFEQMAYDGGFFPYGLYWLQLEGSHPDNRVQSFMSQARGLIFTIKSAESFLTDIAQRLEAINEAS
jgi:hypothetical protein